MDLFDRFKKFKTENWVICILMLIMTVLISSYTIACIINISAGKTIYGGQDSTNFFLKNADILMTILFGVLSIIMFATLVYTVFFKKIEEKEVTRKIIEHGKVVEVKENVSKESKKQNNIPQTTKISSENLKNLKNDLEESSNEKK